MQQTNTAKLRLLKRAKNSLPYMESKRSLTFAKNPITEHYSESGNSSL